MNSGLCNNASMLFSHNTTFMLAAGLVYAWWKAYTAGKNLGLLQGSNSYTVQ
jgi:hypothetical protein